MNIGILGGIAFVVGLGIGTGAVMMRPAAPAAHSAADSTAVAGHDSTAAHEPAAAAAHGEEPPAEPAAEEHAPAAAIPHSAIAATVATASPENFTQVSKILSSMKPVEAAKILVYLSDDQVEGILRSLGVRQAAVMLTQLPTERAAALSRRLLHSNPEKSQ